MENCTSKHIIIIDEMMFRKCYSTWNASAMFLYGSHCIVIVIFLVPEGVCFRELRLYIHSKMIYPARKFTMLISKSMLLCGTAEKLMYKLNSNQIISQMSERAVANHCTCRDPSRCDILKIICELPPAPSCRLFEPAATIAEWLSVSIQYAAFTSILQLA